MMKFVYSIGLIFCGLLLGQGIKKIVQTRYISALGTVEKYIKLLQRLAILGLNPIVTLGAFWGVQLTNIKFVVLPVLGAIAIIVGGGLGYVISRQMKHSRKETGSMFVSASFTNMGNFGGLICFTFFGESSYAFVSLYKMFEEILYFLVGYPIAKLHGDNDESRSGKSPLLKIMTDPFITVYFMSIAIGLILNLSGVVRPDVYQEINEILIPLSSILLITSVGFYMKIKAIRHYLKECAAIATIKFMMIPMVVVTIAYLIGLQSVNDGLLFKVVIVLSAMPPAFNSLIPPQIYGLDVDLANSSWLFNTGLLVVVVPLLYYIVNSF
jgi:hypothetical protein